LFNLGEVASDRGEHERAKELFEEAGALCRELGDTRTLPKYYFNMGNEYLLQGDPQRATELLEEAVKLLAQGRTGGLNDALEQLGWAALMRGDHERAKVLYTESLDLSLGLGDKWVAVGAVVGLACAAAAGAEAEEAARLFGAAEALREAVCPLAPEKDAFRTPYLSMARSRLDETSWEEAWTQGRAMSMEQAMDYALSLRKPLTLLSSESERPSSDEPPTLTPREKEVAVLVSHGLTNRHIASELVLSQHTVDKHVKNILKKLGLRSREQVASRLRGQ
jgi:non-specific serine/threonine protein kinase